MPPTLSLDEQVAAIVCDAAYGAHVDGGIQGQYSQHRAQAVIDKHMQQAREHGRADLAGRLSELKVYRSNQDMVAFVDHQSKQVIIGYRGTSINSRGNVLRDAVINDAFVMLNSTGLRRPITALNFASSVMRDLGSGYTFTHTGHSLGGSLAEYVSIATQTRGIGFNPGSGLINTTQLGRFMARMENTFTAHRIDLDAVSIMPGLRSFQTTTHSATQGIGRHSLSNFLPQYNNLGGINLAGASTTPNLPAHDTEILLGDLIGAVFTADQSAPVLIGQSTTQSSMVTTQDLAVALILAIYRADPAFSLDPWEATNPEGPWLRCVYYPLTANLPFDLSRTSYARTLFEADWLLKQLSMGVDVSKFSAQGPFPVPLPLRALPAELRNMGMRDEFEYDHSIQSTNSRFSRLWITVDQENTIEGDVTSDNAKEGFSASDPLNDIAIQFTDVKLGVKLMRQTRDGEGKLVDLIDPRQTEPNAGDVKFSKFMTEHYDQVAKHYPPLWRLRQLAKLQAIAKWLVEHNVQVDIPAVLQHINQCIGALQPITKVPALDRTGTKSRIHGGVDLRVRKTPQQSTVLSPECKEVLTTMVVKTKTSSNLPKFNMPFLCKKQCSVCEEVLPFFSFFTQSDEGDKVYCPEHHPDACFDCMLPLYIDPTSCKPFATGSYAVSSAPDGMRYHPQCMMCATCNKPLGGKFKVDPLALHSYCHLDCLFPLESFALENPSMIVPKLVPQTTVANEDEELLAVLQESMKTIYQPRNSSQSSTMTSELDFLRHTITEGSSEEEVLAKVLANSKIEDKMPKDNELEQALLESQAEADLNRALQLSVAEQPRRRVEKVPRQQEEDDVQRAIRLSLLQPQPVTTPPVDDLELTQALQLSLQLSSLQSSPQLPSRTPLTPLLIPATEVCPICFKSIPPRELEVHVDAHF